MAKSFLGIKHTLILWYLKAIIKVRRNALERITPGFYCYFQARTKHIDAVLVESINSGIDQLVILGAGYDSRPYRFREKLKGVQIFEVIKLDEFMDVCVSLVHQ